MGLTIVKADTSVSAFYFSIFSVSLQEMATKAQLNTLPQVLKDLVELHCMDVDEKFTAFDDVPPEKAIECLKHIALNIGCTIECSGDKCVITFRDNTTELIQQPPERALEEALIKFYNSSQKLTYMTMLEMKAVYWGKLKLK